MRDIKQENPSAAPVAQSEQRHSATKSQVGFRSLSPPWQMLVFCFFFLATQGNITVVSQPPVNANANIERRTVSKTVIMKEPGPLQAGKKKKMGALYKKPGEDFK